MCSRVDASSVCRAVWWQSRFRGYGPYIASKLGVEGLVRVLGNELRGRSNTVNAVAPGPTATDLFLEGKSEAQIDDLRN